MYHDYKRYSRRRYAFRHFHFKPYRIILVLVCEEILDIPENSIYRFFFNFNPSTTYFRTRVTFVEEFFKLDSIRRPYSGVYYIRVLSYRGIFRAEVDVYKMSPNVFVSMSYFRKGTTSYLLSRRISWPNSFILYQSIPQWLYYLNNFQSRIHA